MTSELMGICSWTVGIDDPEALMSHIASMGLNAVQYCGHFDAYSADEIVQAADHNQLTLIIYDPFECRPGERNGPSSLENAVRFYSAAVDYAAELGVGLTLQGLSTWTEDCATEDARWQRLVAAVQAVHDYATRYGVQLSYEPCNLYEVPLIHTADEFQQLIDDSGCDDICILLDSFHMNIGEQCPKDVLHRFGNRNSVFHISDSNREGIGSGNIDFQSWKQALDGSGFDGPCVMEFVLKGNPVNTPPRNEAEHDLLREQVRNSLAAWNSYTWPGL